MTPLPSRRPRRSQPTSSCEAVSAGLLGGPTNVAASPAAGEEIGRNAGDIRARHPLDPVQRFRQVHLPSEVHLGAGKLRHPAGRALETEHEAALQVILRSLQLVVRHRGPLQGAQLLDHEIDNIRDRPAVAPGVHRQGARVAIRDEAAADGVREPPLLADVLKEPRAHRAAEHRVEHVRDVAIGMVLRIGSRAETDMALLEVLVSHSQPNVHVRRGRGERLAVDRKRGERLADDRAHHIRIDVPRGRDDEIARGIRPAEIGAQRRGVEPLHRLGRAENRTPERMFGPEAGGEDFVNEVVRRVLDHLDLFEDDVLLAPDVAVVERRIQQQVRQDVDGAREVLVEHLDVVAGALLRREGVELPANRIDFLRDAFGGAGGRALEQHVLHEMRDADVVGIFVARAAREPGAETDRPDTRHRLGQEAEAVVEHLARDHVRKSGCSNAAETRTFSPRKRLYVMDLRDWHRSRNDTTYGDRRHPT